MDDKILTDFEHLYNPRHFYCRLKDLGIEKQLAKKYSIKYELEVYIPVMLYLRQKEKLNKNGEI